MAENVSDVPGLSFEVTEKNPEPNSIADSFNTTQSGVSLLSDGANETFYVIVDTNGRRRCHQQRRPLRRVDGQVHGRRRLPRRTRQQPVRLDDCLGRRTDARAERGQRHQCRAIGQPVHRRHDQPRARHHGDDSVPCIGVFFMDQDVTVNQDGTFSGMFDFSGYDNGTEFSVKAMVNGHTDSVSGTLNQNSTQRPRRPRRPRRQRPRRLRPLKRRPRPPDDDDDHVVLEKTTTSSSEETTTNNDGQPGFGVAISVVALLATALLALRREN